MTAKKTKAPADIAVVFKQLRRAQKQMEENTAKLEATVAELAALVMGRAGQR